MYNSWIAALTILTLLALTPPVEAQQPPVNLVSFKATFMPVDRPFRQPSNPPIISVEGTGKGEADFLGPFTLVAHFIQHLGVDGKPLFFTDGLQVLTGANGDAIFQSFVGLPQTGQGAWIVTGGTGRFLGATGSGTFSFKQDSTGKHIVTQIGTISAPKL